MVSGGWTTVTSFPRDEFQRSTRVVARAIAFEKMASLENRSLADINTWTAIDEALADSAAQDLAAGRPVDMKTAAEATTYAAHVLSGGVLAMCASGADIDAIHGGTIQALSSLYDENPVWGGLPVVLPRDPIRHTLFPQERRLAMKKAKPQLRTGAARSKKMAGRTPRSKGKK